MRIRSRSIFNNWVEFYAEALLRFFDACGCIDSLGLLLLSDNMWIARFPREVPENKRRVGERRAIAFATGHQTIYEISWKIRTNIARLIKTIALYDLEWT